MEIVVNYKLSVPEASYIRGMLGRVVQCTMEGC